MKPQRIIKLLEIADRASTNEHEALNALRLVKSALEQAGLSWSELPDALAEEPMPFRTKIVREVKVEVHSDPLDRQRIIELEDRLAELGRESSKPCIVESVRVEHKAGIPWWTFAKIAERLIGGDWQNSPDRFGASAAMIKRWQKDETVPVMFLEKISRVHKVEVQRGRVEPKKRLDIRV